MSMISQENKLIDMTGLNQFRIGDEVVADACAEHDRFEGVVIGIELQRGYASRVLQPSITLLHDGDQITDGFSPDDLRKVSTPPAAAVRGEGLLRAEREIAELMQGAWKARQVGDLHGWSTRSKGRIREIFAALARPDGAEVERLAKQIVQGVCELQEVPDPDHPDAIIVTVDDLEAVICNRLSAALSASPSPVDSRDGLIADEAWEELCKLTFAVQHNPNCRSPWLVRLPGKGPIDMKPYADGLGFVPHQTGDILGFGKTLTEAARLALAAKEQQP